MHLAIVKRWHVGSQKGNGAGAGFEMPPSPVPGFAAAAFVVAVVGWEFSLCAIIMSFKCNKLWYEPVTQSVSQPVCRVSQRAQR